jgi:hypothetical protein
MFDVPPACAFPWTRLIGVEVDGIGHVVSARIIHVGAGTEHPQGVFPVSFSVLAENDAIKIIGAPEAREAGLAEEIEKAIAASRKSAPPEGAIFETVVGYSGIEIRTPRKKRRRNERPAIASGRASLSISGISITIHPAPEPAEERDGERLLKEISTPSDGVLLWITPPGGRNLSSRHQRIEHEDSMLSIHPEPARWKNAIADACGIPKDHDVILIGGGPAGTLSILHHPPSAPERIRVGARIAVPS